MNSNRGLTPQVVQVVNPVTLAVAKRAKVPDRRTDASRRPDEDSPRTEEPHDGEVFERALEQMKRASGDDAASANDRSDSQDPSAGSSDDNDQSSTAGRSRRRPIRR